MVTPQDFIHRLKSQNYVQNIEHHVKVLLKRFRLNGHTTDFQPQTQKFKQYHVNVLRKRFHMSGHTAKFHPPTQKLAKNLSVLRSYVIFLKTDSRKYLRIGVLFGRLSSLQNQQLNLLKKVFLFQFQFMLKQFLSQAVRIKTVKTITFNFCLFNAFNPRLLF